MLVICGLLACLASVSATQPSCVFRQTIGKILCRCHAQHSTYDGNLNFAKQALSKEQFNNINCQSRIKRIVE